MKEETLFSVILSTFSRSSNCKRSHMRSLPVNENLSNTKGGKTKTRGCGVTRLKKFSLLTFVKWPWISLQPRISFAFLSPICCRPFSSLREPELRTCRIFCLDCSSTDVSSWDSQPSFIMFSLPSGSWEREKINSLMTVQMPNGISDNRNHKSTWWDSF